MVPGQVKVMKDGKELWCYGGNVVLKDGKATFQITIPVNEKTGTWQIVATELASGKTASANLKLK